MLEAITGMNAEMQQSVILALGKLGGIAALGLAAIGSALGCGAAGMASAGALKRSYSQNKMPPFMVVGFVGFPLSQTIYGIVVMFALNRPVTVENGPALAAIGILITVGSGLYIVLRERSLSRDAARLATMPQSQP